MPGTNEARLWITFPSNSHLCLIQHSNYVDTGNSQWWQLILVDTPSSKQGYLLAYEGLYISKETVNVPYRGSALAMTEDPAKGLIVVPVVDTNNETFHLHQANSDLCLTLDTRGELGRLEAYQDTNREPIFQHFVLDGNIR